tara:strand:+ start:9906 stop:10223 length:318 start_codon:yes stop_codon:yes gene_type:complete
MSNIQDLFKSRFARYGSTFINSTTKYNGKWFAVVVLEDDTKFHGDTAYETTNFPVIDGDAFKNNTAGSAEAFAKDTILYGNFTAIKLHAGKVLALKDNTATAATT